MTTVYFVRHAEVEYEPAVEDHLRPLSSDGLLKTNDIIKYFDNKQIDSVISSPYKRAVQTVQGISNKRQIEIKIYEDLRERKISSGHINDFNDFAYKQWMNHDFKFENGDSLNETRIRAIKVLEEIIKVYNSKTIVIGTHGTILSVILNHYDNNFGYEKWKAMKMPEIYKLELENRIAKSIEKIEI